MEIENIGTGELKTEDQFAETCNYSFKMENDAIDQILNNHAIKQEQEALRAPHLMRPKSVPKRRAS